MLCTFITSVANCNCYFYHVDFFKMYIFIIAFGTYVESITLIFELSEFSIAKTCSPFIFNSPSTCAIAHAIILEDIRPVRLGLFG